jgi:RNA polymerase sigma-B factor
MVVSQGLAKLDRQQIQQLFSAYRHSQDRALREQLALAHTPLAAYLARRFANRGEPIDDLIQVATIGLLKAIDRFDPARGVQFSTYASITIGGEIRRHFRDRCWTIRISRGLRELNNRLMRTMDKLSQELGRSPTIDEIAREGGVPFERAVEAFEVGRAYNPVSLDAQVEGEEEEYDRLGADDPAIQGAEDRVSLERAIRCLAERLQATIRMRYFLGMGQAEVARRLRTSQMAVSRLERQALELLRAMVSWHDGAPAPVTPSNGGAERTGNGHAGNGNGGTGHVRRPARVQPLPAVLGPGQAAFDDERLSKNPGKLAS